MALGAALIERARADGVEDYYKGRTITWILSAGAGGGYSTYAQAFAPYWSAHLPGKPGFSIQNMPGAGGIRAMQYLYANAPRDGGVVALVHSSVPFAPLFDLPGSNFDPRQFNWIGSLASESELCVAWRASGVETWRDLLTKEFIVGGTGGGSQMETLPLAINRLFGTHIKIVSGYNSGAEVDLAMERGEVQGRCSIGASSIDSTRPEWFAKNLVSVPVQVSLRHDPRFPNAPTLLELAQDEQTRRILRVLLSYEEMERPLLAPPGVPPERVAALRSAFHEAMSDPGFLAEAKRLNIGVEELSGDKIAAILSDAYALPSDVARAARNALSPETGVVK